jgi:hypothetical protein
VTEKFNGEIKISAYPKAALLLLAMAFATYNILAIIRAVLDGANGFGKVKAELSNYHQKGGRADPILLDVADTINDSIAFSYCHQIAKLEGLLLSASTGSILAGGLTYTHKHQDRPRSILMLNPD